MQKSKFSNSQKESFLPYAPIVLVRDVLKRWLVVLTVMVVAVAAAYIISDEFYEPVYQTEATLVITSRDTTTTIFSNLKSTQELASVFSGLLNSSTLQNVVLEDIGMSSVDCAIAAAAIDETNLMTITVKSPDPRTAFLVLNSLIEHHEVVTYEVIGDVVIEVLQRPVVPTTPVNTADSMKYVRIAAGAAVVLSCAAILLYSYARDVVRSQQEAEQKLNCWCLGEINHEKKNKTFDDMRRRRKRGLVITSSDVSFRFVETVRKMRRRVEQYMDGRKVLMVTSVMENEGKTTIAVNLALSLAQKHRRVLLVDLDLRKPACHKILNQRSIKHSALDVILRQAELTDAVMKEKLSGLNMLLEKPDHQYKPDKVTALMASGKIAEMIAEARKHYDYVILDLPPMSAAPDTEYIMEYADASLLVVKQNQVHAKALNRAIAVLEKGNAKLLGCVMNNVYSSSLSLESGAAYGYGYGYGYGHYGSYGK